MSKKFIVWLRTKETKVLKQEMKKRDVTVQELVRAVVIPEWLDKHGYLSIRLIRGQSEEAGDSHAGR